MGHSQPVLRFVTVHRYTIRVLENATITMVIPRYSIQRVDWDLTGVSLVSRIRLSLIWYSVNEISHTIFSKTVKLINLLICPILRCRVVVLDRRFFIMMMGMGIWGGIVLVGWSLRRVRVR
jgi:hypothetical protein